MDLSGFSLSSAATSEWDYVLQKLDEWEYVLNEMDLSGGSLSSAATSAHQAQVSCQG
jgi:hypothetical protein